MQLDPKTQMWIAAVVAIITLAAHGTLALPTGIPPEAGAVLASWSNFILQIYAVVSPIMLAYSSSKPGPLAPPDPPAVIAATLASQPAPGAKP